MTGSKYIQTPFMCVLNALGRFSGRLAEDQLQATRAEHTKRRSRRRRWARCLLEICLVFF